MARNQRYQSNKNNEAVLEDSTNWQWQWVQRWKIDRILIGQQRVDDGRYQRSLTITCCIFHNLERREIFREREGKIELFIGWDSTPDAVGEQYMGKIRHITRPATFCWKAPPMIDRLKTPMQKFKGNGFLAVIPVYSITVGVAIRQVSCWYCNARYPSRTKGYFNTSILEERALLLGGTIEGKLKEGSWANIDGNFPDVVCCLMT